jgi:hypothetical protein
MKIKPTTQRGRVVLEMNARDEQLLADGSVTTKTEASPFKLKNILVPIDFSDNSLKALQYALPFAEKHKARVTLIQVRVEACIPWQHR